jgi:hypothetical protein
MDTNNINKKESAFLFVFVVISLFVYKIFPIQNIVQSIISLFLFFVIVPILFNKYIAKKKISEMGLKIGDYRKGFLFGGISIAFSVIVLVFIFRYADLLKHYPLPGSVSVDFAKFLYYELAIVLGLVVVFEIFFRGFLMFSFEKLLGYWSILFQWMFFFFTIWIMGRSVWDFLPFVVFAQFAVFIAKKSDSIFYSGLSQLILVIIFDSFVIHALK